MQTISTSEVFAKNGFIKQVLGCSRVGFSSCKKIQYYTTVQSFSELDIEKHFLINYIVLGIGSFLNISDPLQAWGIDQVIVNEIEPGIQLPQICSLWYEGNCINQCPSYSTLNGITCVDYGSIFKNPYYIFKEFYPNHIITSYSRQIFNITNREFYQFENRFLYLLNTNFQGGILWQKFDIQNPHRKLRLMISVLLIDWQNNSQDYFLELVIGTSLNQQRYKFYADSSKQFIDYQLNQEFPDYIYRNFTLDFIHSQNSFNLELRCFSPFDGYCSLFDYFILIEKCDHGCSQCNQNGDCLKYDASLEEQIINKQTTYFHYSYNYSNYVLSLLILKLPMFRWLQV